MHDLEFVAPRILAQSEASLSICRAAIPMPRKNPVKALTRSNSLGEKMDAHRDGSFI
jgi:hypothetical protein